ncbi:hypothetical protein B0H16DRAFT_1476907 [Mycena metata]|uniref:DUF6535 domain-containing protein n=1 Tax=Mycena metata TaxID=1033252 RepID=A0AAD7HBC3_9AGAR|nr:hypothetical protein B0H16DRAFT_1476907 [Mycena metata]
MDTEDRLSWLFERPSNDDPSHDRAAAKLWSVYISEAEKYDKGLVESWKSDMEGMLIFTPQAGLFSASLTAFIIESYKTLTPDSGAMTNLLLVQISSQMAAAANGTSFTPPSSPPFVPPATSLVCNAFWFFSLGLSLTCALVATLLEQWARDFLHKADMHSTPAIRARMFSYLYYGLQRFNMHAVVEVVPLLLHVSLIFFFAGLVAFLIPVNIAMAVIAGVLVFVVAGGYLLLTVLPLLSLDCPYRTPLSGMFWKLLQLLIRWRPNPVNQPDAALPDTTIVEAIFHSATEISPARTTRDTRALAWTVKSLSNDAGLEPFFEAIPDILWDPHRRRNVYDAHIHALIHDPEVQLLDRLYFFFRSSRTGIIPADVKRHQRITFYKALCAILGVYDDLKAFPRLNSFTYMFATRDPAVDPYECSASALISWHQFQRQIDLIPSIMSDLQKCKQDVQSGKTPDFKALLSSIEDLDVYTMKQEMREFLNTPDSSASALIARWVVELEEFHITSPLHNFLAYLERTAEMDSPPYLFQPIVDLISPRHCLLSTAKHVESCLQQIIYGHMERFNHPPKDNRSGFLDKIVVLALQYWRPARDSSCLPLPVIHYIQLRKSTQALNEFLWQFSAYGDLLWACVPATLLNGPSLPYHVYEETNTSTIVALWSLLYFSQELYDEPIYPTLPVCMSILDAVHSIPSSPVSQSVVALLKHKIFLHLRLDRPVDEPLQRLQHPILPTETSVPINELRQSLARAQPGFFDVLVVHRIEEARIVLVSELLDSCHTDMIPHNATDTLSRTSSFCRYHVHPMHQIRFARSVRRLFSTLGDRNPTLLQEVVNLFLFDAYAPNSTYVRIESYLWLDDPLARRIIKDTLSEYQGTLTPTDPQRLLLRVEEIINNLNSFHPVQEVPDDEIAGSGIGEALDPSPSVPSDLHPEASPP